LGNPFEASFCIFALSLFKLKHASYVKRGVSVQKAKRLIIAALFSSIIFVINFLVPPPISYLLIVVQAVILALANLFLGKAGATYVGLIGGFLSALSRPAFGPFTFLFTFLFGFMVDAFSFAFKVSSTAEGVKRNRVMLVMTFSTAIIGLLSYYTTAVYLQLVNLDPMMSGLVIFVAMGSGLSAGYATAYLWNKYLKNISLA
jgi:uncharacterized membrane protein